MGSASNHLDSHTSFSTLLPLSSRLPHASSVDSGIPRSPGRAPLRPQGEKGWRGRGERGREERGEEKRGEGRGAPAPPRESAASPTRTRTSGGRAGGVAWASRSKLGVAEARAAVFFYTGTFEDLYEGWNPLTSRQSHRIAALSDLDMGNSS